MGYSQITETDLVPMVAAQRVFRGAAGGVEGKFYGQAERAISNGQLNVLLRLHTRPIKLVVYQCSYYLLRLGDLILRKVSR